MVAFPDEMKATKTGIDAVGREINVMTKSLGRYKETTARIGAVRAAYGALGDGQKDIEHSFGKEERHRARIAEFTGRLDEIALETTRLQADPSLALLDSERERCAGLTRERDDLLRHYASLTMTASHVFRKAEKIATRKNLTKEVHILKEAMDILSDHEVASAETVGRVLDLACPVVQKMVDDGDILLKNKEERTVFSDTAGFSGEVGGMCTQYRKLEKDCREAEEGLLSHPILTRLHALEREKGQLEGMRVREEQGLTELLTWRQNLTDAAPGLQEDLVKKLEYMIGDTVQFQMNEPGRG
jgi:hypothetical protein